MVWIFLLVVLISCIVAAVIYDRHVMKQKWDASAKVDMALVREAADASLYASNSENELIALEESVRAHRTVEALVRRYGVKEATEQAGVNVQDLLETLRRQRDNIRQHIADRRPELIPKGPLTRFVGYIREREAEEETVDTA
jgi:hypothetical protein